MELGTDLINEGLAIGLKTLGAALLAVATAYVPRMARAVEKWLGVDIPDGWEKRGLDLAGVAIDYAEEWGREQLRDKIGDTDFAKKLGGEKMKKAAEFFRKHARGKVTKWGAEKIREVLGAKLQDKRQLEKFYEKANPENLDGIIAKMEETIAKIDAAPSFRDFQDGKVKQLDDGSWIRTE